MEKDHQVYFTNNYIHRTLHTTFIRSNSHSYGNSKEFAAVFQEIFTPNLQKSKFYSDYKRKLDGEMQKFNGRILVGEGTETASELTSGTRGTMKSNSTKVKGGMFNNASPGRGEDLDEAATMKGMVATINDRDNTFDPDPTKTMANN